MLSNRTVTLDCGDRMEEIRIQQSAVVDLSLTQDSPEYSGGFATYYDKKLFHSFLEVLTLGFLLNKLEFS